MKHIKKSSDPTMRQTVRIFILWLFSFVEFFSTARPVCSQTVPNGWESAWESREPVRAWHTLVGSACPRLSRDVSMLPHSPLSQPPTCQASTCMGAGELILTAPLKGAVFPLPRALPWKPALDRNSAGGGGPCFQAFGNDLNPPLHCFHLIQESCLGTLQTTPSPPPILPTLSSKVLFKLLQPFQLLSFTCTSLSSRLSWLPQKPEKSAHRPRRPYVHFLKVWLLSLSSFSQAKWKDRRNFSAALTWSEFEMNKLNH